MGERAHPIDMHGWDCLHHVWHGPHELEFSLTGCRYILAGLGNAQGSWYGRLHKQEPREPLVGVHASVYDLGDAGLGILDVENASGGPEEVVVVAPAGRLPALRPEFAFEFLSFLRFLGGPEIAGSEVAIHDHIERVLREADGSRTTVFFVETRPMEPEAQLLVSRHGEKLVMSMIAWMAAKDGTAPDPLSGE